MSKNFSTPDFKAIAEKTIRQIRIIAEVEGVNFFKENFNREGFLDDSLEKWENRKNDIDPGRAILMKSAALRDSIEVKSSNKTSIEFGSDEPYAEIHNQGGTITATVTPKMRRFFWFMYRKTGSEKWKWMALTKKQRLTIQIPKRQFIGESKTLLNQLDEEFKQLILQNFKGQQ